VTYTDNTPWTRAEVKHLIRRADEGASASVIGRELGKSRSAVLGKAFRLKVRLYGVSDGRRRGSGESE
jgi:hypothetical protein